uniref:Reverse transcriptase zinc-binding domain-containing protein n=1 Tax=Brassica oleracea TaxID=3712 RepID=A0A3P6C5D3_BRAOL|nr:unnamed protein product [Brassica oleracea]
MQGRTNFVDYGGTIYSCICKIAGEMSSQVVMCGTVFDWIKQVVGNGKTCYFWSSKWSPFGNISKNLRGESSHTTGIPATTTLAEIWESGN